MGSAGTTHHMGPMIKIYELQEVSRAMKRRKGLFLPYLRSVYHR